MGAYSRGGLIRGVGAKSRTYGIDLENIHIFKKLICDAKFAYQNSKIPLGIINACDEEYTKDEGKCMNEY